MSARCGLYFFFFNDTATTEIYTLSLHDALPISMTVTDLAILGAAIAGSHGWDYDRAERRSEEHTSELQSRPHIVCRLLLEKKKRHSSAMPSTSPVITRNALESDTRTHASVQSRA